MKVSAPGRRAFLLLALGLTSTSVLTANRTASKRSGGTTSSGKGSHYVGGHKTPKKPAPKPAKK